MFDNSRSKFIKIVRLHSPNLEGTNCSSYTPQSPQTHIYRQHYSYFIRAYSSLGIMSCSLLSPSLLIAAASSRVKNFLLFLLSRVFITRLFLTKIRSQQAMSLLIFRIFAHVWKIFLVSFNRPLSARENFIVFAILKSRSSLISSLSCVSGNLSLANRFKSPILDLKR